MRVPAFQTSVGCGLARCGRAVGWTWNPKTRQVEVRVKTAVAALCGLLIAVVALAAPGTAQSALPAETSASVPAADPEDSSTPGTTDGTGDPTTPEPTEAPSSSDPGEPTIPESTVSYTPLPMEDLNRTTTLVAILGAAALAILAGAVALLKR
jgi:hypothetical protein